MNTVQELQGNYSIDPSHSRLGFVARHAMVTKVRGNFNEFSGSANTEANLANAHVEVEANVSSIDTRNKDRDNHLRTNDFFAADQYPTLKFVSTNIKATDSDSLEITGDLTLRGVTKEITIPFEYQGGAVDPYGNQRIGFEGTTQINRKDFGLTFDAKLETGGLLVSDKITLEFELSLIKQG